MIKDQCEKCKKYGTSNCGQIITYNSLSCESYVKKLDLSKSGDRVDSFSVTPPSSRQNPPRKSNNNQSNNNAVPLNNSIGSFLFSFRGRRRRSHYFVIMLCTGGLSYLLNFSVKGMPDGDVLFSFLLTIPLLWIYLANESKRCHDLGKSGWLVLFSFVPMVNVFLSFYLLFAEGDFYDNKYGDSPY